MNRSNQNWHSSISCPEQSGILFHGFVPTQCSSPDRYPDCWEWNEAEYFRTDGKFDSISPEP
jgi:hypothetical protein